MACLPCFIIVNTARKLKKSLATPHSNNPYTTYFRLRIVSVDDSKRRVDQLPQIRLFELWNYSPDFRMLGQNLYPFEDLGHQPNSDVRHALVCIPCHDFFEVTERRLRKTDAVPWHRSAQSQPRFGVGERYLPACLQIG